MIDTATVPGLRCMANIPPQKIDWLWPGKIAHGKVTMLASDPGCGKSTVTTDLAARISTGSPWPLLFDGQAPKGGTLIVSDEDDPNDTIRPRLDAAGADVSRVHILELSDLGGGADRLDAAIGKIEDCRLCVIDPISAYLGKIDSHKNAEVRGVLKQLAVIASKRRCAIVCVSHLSKSTKSAAIYRTIGSLAFVAAARSAWVIVKDRDDEKRRLILPIKNNIGPDNQGMAYRLNSWEKNDDVAVVNWERMPVMNNADDALNAWDPEQQSRRTERSRKAEGVIRAVLADGPVSLDNIAEAVHAKVGLSKRTTRRALEDMGAVSFKESGDGGRWLWRLPG